MKTKGIIVLACASLSGCGLGATSTEGELGRGDFTYTCALGADDALCDAIGDAQAIPAVATGGAFALRYEANNGMSYSIAPASARHVDESITGLSVGVPGPAGLFAVDWGGNVYDVVHVWAYPVSSLDLLCEGWLGSGDCGAAVELGTDEIAEIEAVPTASGGATLGGVLDYTWEIADTSVASFVWSLAGRAVQIRGDAPGTTTLSITAGGVARQLEITVNGEIDTDTDTDTDTDVDAGTDAGAFADASTGEGE